MVSRFNSSNLNITNGSTFEGRFEDVSNYGSINISLNTDVKFILTLFWSSNGISTDSQEAITQSTTPTGTLYYQRDCKAKFFRLVLLNDDTITSERLFLQTIYKSFAINPSSGTVTVSNLPKDGDGNLKVAVQNTSLAVTNADLTNIYNVVNSRGSGVLWSGSATGAGGVSLAVDLSNKNIKNITFMGNCNGSTLLTVQFSSDGTTYYDSQYAFTLSASGDVGFSLACCPNYTRVKSSNNVTASLYINYC
jgi:hypothetical protein